MYLLTLVENSQLDSQISLGNDRYMVYPNQFTQFWDTLESQGIMNTPGTNKAHRRLVCILFSQQKYAELGNKYVKIIINDMLKNK